VHSGADPNPDTWQKIRSRPHYGRHPNVHITQTTPSGKFPSQHNKSMTQNSDFGSGRSSAPVSFGHRCRTSKIPTVVMLGFSRQPNHPNWLRGCQSGRQFVEREDAAQRGKMADSGRFHYGN